jgi:hypothetical protein
MTNKEIGFIKIHELVTRFNEQLTCIQKIRLQRNTNS